MRTVTDAFQDPGLRTRTRIRVRSRSRRVASAISRMRGALLVVCARSFRGMLVGGRIEGMCRGRDSGRGQRRTRTRTRTHDGRRTTDDEKAKRTKPGKTHRQSSLVINRASPSPPDALDHRATGSPCHWVPGRTPSASSRPAVHPPSVHRHPPVPAHRCQARLDPTPTYD